LNDYARQEILHMGLGKDALQKGGVLAYPYLYTLDTLLADEVNRDFKRENA